MNDWSIPFIRFKLNKDGFFSFILNIFWTIMFPRFRWRNSIFLLFSCFFFLHNFYCFTLLLGLLLNIDLSDKCMVWIELLMLYFVNSFDNLDLFFCCKNAFYELKLCCLAVVSRISFNRSAENFYNRFLLF